MGKETNSEWPKVKTPVNGVDRDEVEGSFMLHWVGGPARFNEKFGVEEALLSDLPDGAVVAIAFSRCPQGKEKEVLDAKKSMQDPDDAWYRDLPPKIITGRVAEFLARLEMETHGVKDITLGFTDETFKHLCDTLAKPRAKYRNEETDAHMSYDSEAAKNSTWKKVSVPASSEVTSADYEPYVLAAKDGETFLRFVEHLKDVGVELLGSPVLANDKRAKDLDGTVEAYEDFDRDRLMPRLNDLAMPKDWAERAAKADYSAGKDKGGMGIA